MINFFATTFTHSTVNWDFSHTSKQIYRQLQYNEKLFEEFVSLSQKNGFALVDQVWHPKALNQCSMAQKIR